MDILHQRGTAGAADVLAALPDPPSYSAVRALLKTLEAKGHIAHRVEGANTSSLPASPPPKPNTPPSVTFSIRSSATPPPKSSPLSLTSPPPNSPKTTSTAWPSSSKTPEKKHNNSKGF